MNPQQLKLEVSSMTINVADFADKLTVQHAILRDKVAQNPGENVQNFIHMATANALECMVKALIECHMEAKTGDRT